MFHIQPYFVYFNEVYNKAGRALRARPEKNTNDEKIKNYFVYA